MVQFALALRELRAGAGDPGYRELARRALYSASTLYCMTTSLAEGGAGLGAAMGEAKARELAHDAGFGHFRRLPIDHPFAALYELKA